MEKRYYVYVYYDPRTNQPFYVGKGTGTRLYDHLTESLERTSNERKHYKIQSIRRDGLEPIIKKYEDNLTDDEAYDLEAELILKWGRKDFDDGGILFNIVEAGRRTPSFSGEDHYNWGKKGAMLGRKLTPDQIKKVVDSKKGKKRKPFSNEWIKKMSDAKQGEKNNMYCKTHTEETRDKIRKKAKNRIFLPEDIEKRSESIHQNAIKRYQRIIPEILDIQQSGITTYRGIARELNNRGFTTDRGATFRDDIVKRIITVMNNETTD